MTAQKTAALDYLLALSEEAAPEFLQQLPAEELESLQHYIEHVVHLKTAGLDRLFESFSIVLKYIPNIVIYKLAPKYTEPSIAAQISEKLTVKQAVGLTSGFELDYLGEITRYMNPQLAATLMQEIKPALADKLTLYAYQHFPLKGLDIACHLPEKSLLRVAELVDPYELNDNLMSQSRQEVLEKLMLLRKQ